MEENKDCSYCHATVTPMWRHGPGIYSNLCNSCGVKWRRGKILSQDPFRHPLLKKKLKNANLSDSDSCNTSFKVEKKSKGTHSTRLETLKQLMSNPSCLVSIVELIVNENVLYRNAYDRGEEISLDIHGINDETWDRLVDLQP